MEQRKEFFRLLVVVNTASCASVQCVLWLRQGGLELMEWRNLKRFSIVTTRTTSYQPHTSLSIRFSLVEFHIFDGTQFPLSFFTEWWLFRSPA